MHLVKSAPTFIQTWKTTGFTRQKALSAGVVQDRSSYEFVLHYALLCCKRV